MISPQQLIWVWLAELRALLLPQAAPVLLALALGIVVERYVVVPVRRRLAAK